MHHRLSTSLLWLGTLFVSELLASPLTPNTGSKGLIKDSESSLDSDSENLGYLHLALSRYGVGQDSSKGSTSKSLVRDSIGDHQIPVVMDNEKAYYQVTVSVGTPGTSVDLVVDTGSSDTWVSSSQFDSSKSSTFAKNDSAAAFSISYGDNSKATGYWGTDVFTLDNTTVAKDISFAVADSNSGAQPILGLGLEQGEATVTAVTTDGILQPTYQNLPVQLRDQGLIYKIAYSLWLNDKNAGEGQLLFGGVDHSKYQGDSLGLVPVVNDKSVPSASNPTTLSVMLHGIVGGSVEYGTSIPVLLDSGSTMSYLPQGLINAISQELGANMVSGYYSVPCDIQGQFIFNISGLQMPVEYSDLVMTVSDSNSQFCALSLAVHDQTQRFILGDNVLRNWYVVYDLEDMQIGLAPAVFNTTESNVEAISSGIPSASSAGLYSATATNTQIVQFAASSPAATSSQSPPSSSFTAAASSSGQALSSAVSTGATSQTPSSSSIIPTSSPMSTSYSSSSSALMSTANPTTSASSQIQSTAVTTAQTSSSKLTSYAPSSKLSPQTSAFAILANATLSSSNSTLSTSTSSQVSSTHSFIYSSHVTSDASSTSAVQTTQNTLSSTGAKHNNAVAHRSRGGHLLLAALSAILCGAYLN